MTNELRIESGVSRHPLDMSERSFTQPTFQAESSPAVRKPADLLREEYFQRKANHPSYSVSAFARDLGISQSLLSLVFSGKRPLSLKQATQIVLLLDFPHQKAERFIECAILALPGNSKALKKIRRGYQKASGAQASRLPLFVDQELERFKILSQWYHLPILDLSTTRGFSSDPIWIARRLGISSVQAKDAMERLVQLGMASWRGGVFRKIHSKIHFPSGKSESFVRCFHQQMIGKALDELKRTGQGAFKAREISGTTVAIPKSRVEAASKMIQKFQQDFAAFVTEGACDEVYQLNIQMFPLTQSADSE